MLSFWHRRFHSCPQHNAPCSTGRDRSSEHKRRCRWCIEGDCAHRDSWDCDWRRFYQVCGVWRKLQCRQCLRRWISTNESAGRHGGCALYKSSSVWPTILFMCPVWKSRIPVCSICDQASLRKDTFLAEPRLAIYIRTDCWAECPLHI